MNARIWGVEVNEVKVLTYSGSDPGWWIAWRAHMEPTGRIAVLVASVTGDAAYVACVDKAAAQELAASWVEQKRIHKSALKVRRLTSADVDAQQWAAMTEAVDAVRGLAGEAP